MPEEFLQIEKAVYGGDGLARQPDGKVILVPFVLPGERLSLGSSPDQLTVLQPSPDRVTPRCVHFGTCGGCQYQMADYPAQLALKASILTETLDRAGTLDFPQAKVHGSPDPWGYRNRIRLRVRTVDGAVALGYSVRASKDFLPVRMCPIAAPVLWSAAKVLTQLAERDRNVAEWMLAASEVELVCNERESAVQIHLLCPGAVPQRKGSFAQFALELKSACPPVVSAGASKLHLASGRATHSLARWGADGLEYRAGEDRFWLPLGSFFQVNRLLLDTTVDTVCAGRHGQLAWDLFAGVGLFARRLARQFTAVTAVEANPIALPELRRGLARSGDTAIQDTTLSFLRNAVVQRDRPELIVLDPPRAGAGEEACALLLKLSPAEIVYVSCDPTTLARDLQVLAAQYRVAELHLIDLFPQTYHLETVMVLRRKDVQG